MKVLIATPMYGGNCKGPYTESLIALIFKLNSRGHQTIYSKVYNESLVTRARNTLAHEFLSSDADAMLFIDADHWFDADDVVKMIECGKDLIGAVYPMKNINWDSVRDAVAVGIQDLRPYTGYFAANMLPGTSQVAVHEPMEMDNVPTGMMFITRRVFEEMEPNCSKYASHGSDGFLNFDKMITEYFKTQITPEGILLSEDFDFCYEWRKLGGKVYAAPWVKITHIGEYEFSGNFIRSLVLQTPQADTLVEKPKK